MDDFLTLKVVLTVFAFIILMDVVYKTPEELAKRPVKVISAIRPFVSPQDSIRAAIQDSTAAEVNIPK